MSLLEEQSILLLSTFHSLMQDSCLKCFHQIKAGFLKNMNSCLLIMCHIKDVALSRSATIQACTFYLSGTSKQFSVKSPVQPKLKFFSLHFVFPSYFSSPTCHHTTSNLQRNLQGRYIKRKQENNICRSSPLLKNVFFLMILIWG